MRVAHSQFAAHLTGKLSTRQAVIGILGMGYVGQPLALRYAELGYKVLGFDIDVAKVAELNAGRSHIEHISNADIARANARSMECTTDFSRATEADA
ncbi:MAG: UDP-N-acetyl-D-glucosamine dehydrogenase, partial [Sphingopyxis sp.]|nr:UDP-N-acetyl-D-glucosamine dehydrogenase [Sphingopyxis sp.]